MIVMLNRTDYWQCGYLIPKGGVDEVKNEGLPAFRQAVADISPFVSNRVGEIKTFLGTWPRPELLTKKIVSG